MRVARAIAEALTELGVTHAFGLMGSGNYAVTESLVACGARFVAARHEGGAVVMADAYARLTGEVGVCTVHQGPGLTNTTTGLTEASKSRTPLLVLAADTPAGAVRSNFRIDQRGLAEAVGAGHERLGGPESAVADVVCAWRRARAERRPIVVSLPIDVQAAEAPALAVPAPPALPARVAPPADAVERAARLLAGAERPLLIGGRGAVLAGARAPIEALADACGALLATSAVANGLFAGSPWSLGISGGFASPLAAELIGAADAVVSFGATLNMWTTRHGRLVAPSAAVVQVDVDDDAIGAHHRADVGVAGDAGLAASALLAALGDGRRAGWRTPALREAIAARRWRDEPYTDAGDGSRIDPRTLARSLDDLLPDERLIAVDSGHFMGWLPMYCRVPDERGFVFTQAFQSVGLGLATAIGAAVARPDRLTVAGLGDGGALMGLADLETVARLGLPMLVVVFNDAAYGAEVHHFGPEGVPIDLVRFPDTDFAALGRAAGCDGITVRSAPDLSAVERWLGSRSRALVVDAKVVPGVVAEWLSEAFGH
ncbi:MAG TPA: thiamine pyrophosphate-binding protein [Candidatus Dormibacteraeota bacterium]|nr:thiamine pyrophosphate-binding protein [Candidatus Dormibacteraeota bacterium]